MVSYQLSVWKIGIVFYSLLGLFSISVLSADTALGTISEENSILVDPELVGPEKLCIVFGGVIGTYSGGGDPATDIYSWLVLDSEGNELFNRSGGSQFETIKVSFDEIGIYQVQLSVRRGTQIIYEDQLSVNVSRGPELALLPDYLLCGVEPVELIAINPETPNISNYTFTWKDIGGNIVGDQNKFYVAEEGTYIVELFISSSSGVQNCLIRGETYVGPSLDFEVFASKPILCEGEQVILSTDTPISGEWFIQKPGSSQKESIGSAFSLTLKTEDLNDLGVYKASFSTPDPLFPDCPSERSVTFEVTESPNISVREINLPRDCVDPTGIFSVNAISGLDSLIIPELNFIQKDIPLGLENVFEDLLPQIYTVSAFKNGCEFTTLMILEAQDPPTSSNPPSQVEVNYTFEKEECNEFTVTPGFINVRFPEGKINAEYRILSTSRGVIRQGAINDQDSLQVSLSSGRYFFELKIEGCTYPIEEFRIENQPQVSFSNPALINICETFDFVPQTSEDLLFTLQFPDGTVQELSSGDAFILTEPGDYELIGRERNGTSGNCPRSTTFSASLSEPIVFDAVLIEEDCFGNEVYEAQLQGIESNEASIRWLNESNEIVGRNEIFYPTGIGKYSLVVQPLASGFCEVAPVNFEVEPPVLSVPVSLEATKICPEPGSSIITLETDEEEVTNVEWIFYDSLDNRTDLIEFENSFEIQVFEIGTYEAVVYNELGCEIGRTLIPVENSQLLTLPELNDTYDVCNKDNSIPAIDPGEYMEYAWYFEETLVSTSRLFKPTEVGNYTLWVTTEDGCEFADQFRTIEVCSFDVVFPNALVLGDPDRDFRVLVSEGVTDAEVFIHNRQGALVHHSEALEIDSETPILRWQGDYQGQKIIPGTYAVVLILRNSEYGFEEKVTSSLLVLD